MADELPDIRIITIQVEPGKDVEVNYDGFHFYEAEAALVRALVHVHDAEDSVGKFGVEFIPEFPEDDADDEA